MSFLTGTSIAFANAHWGYWAILVFCFFFAVTGVWWSLSTPSIILVQRSPLQRPAGGTGLYWFFDWRNKMACAEAAIANLATEPNRAASAACPHPLQRRVKSEMGRVKEDAKLTAESSPPLMLSFVEVSVEPPNGAALFFVIARSDSDVAISRPAVCPMTSQKSARWACAAASRCLVEDSSQ